MTLKEQKGQAIAALNNLKVAIEKFYAHAEKAQPMEDRKAFVGELFDPWCNLTDRYGELTQAVLGLVGIVVERYPDMSRWKPIIKDLEDG